MPLKNRILPLFILSLLFLIKCKDSPTQSNAPTQVAEQTSVTEVDASGSAPEQLAPSDTAKNVTRVPTFKWKPVDGADEYQLDYQLGGDHPVIHQKLGKTNFTPDKALAAQKTYYWHVRALKEGNPGEWAEIQQFKTRAELDSSALGHLAAPEQVAPSGDAKNVARVPTFKWEPVDGADEYQLDYQLGGDQPAVHQKLGKTNFTPDNALAAQKTYYWHVRALKEGNPGEWAEIQQFKTRKKLDSSELGHLAAPEQVAPSGNAKNVARVPTFKWKPVDGADAYQLDYQLGGDQPVIHQKLKETNFTPDKALAAQETYYWHVQALKGGNSGEWAEIQHFTTGSSTSDNTAREDTLTTKLKAPKNNVQSQPVNVELQWNKVSGASAYKVQLTQGDQFKSFVVNKSVKATFYKVSDLKNDENYTWRVEPIVPSKKTKWSEVYTFTTSTSVVSLLSPDGGATNQALTLSLEWKSLSGISQYRVQVATESDFNNPVTNKTTNNTVYKLSGMKNAQTYYWRVQATGDGNSSNWSTARSFDTKAAVQNDGSSSSSVSSDRQALMDLYQATDGDNWTNNSDWGNGNPSNSWHGIETDENGRVTRIDLYDNNLRGKLPASIGSLNKVKYFNVKGNHLTGKIPVEIGKMTSLEELILQGRNYDLDGILEPPVGNWTRGYHQGKYYSNTNEFSGQIPSEIGNLSNLVAFELSNAKEIVGPIPSELGNLSKLKGLYLSRDNFGGYTIPSSFGNLTNLKHLYISRTGLTGTLPSSLQNLTGLTVFNMVGNADDAAPNIPDATITGDLPDLSQFTDLNYLSLSNNNFDGQFPQYINNGNFTQLNEFNLSGNNLTGTLPDLNNLPNLYYFGAARNQLTGNINAIVDLPDKIKIIAIDNNNLSGDFPQSGWPDYYQLKTIKFQDNNITGNIPCSFWDKLDNSRLRRAFFNHNKIDDPCTSGADAVVGVGGSLDLRY